MGGFLVLTSYSQVLISRPKLTSPVACDERDSHLDHRTCVIRLRRFHRSRLHPLHARSTKSRAFAPASLKRAEPSNIAGSSSSSDSSDHGLPSLPLCQGRERNAEGALCRDGQPRRVDSRSSREQVVEEACRCKNEQVARHICVGLAKNHQLSDSSHCNP